MTQFRLPVTFKLPYIVTHLHSYFLNTCSVRGSLVPQAVLHCGVCDDANAVTAGKRNV